MNEVFDRAIKSARRGATHVIVAPSGPLLLTFETTGLANVGAVVARVDPDSPVADLVASGWLLVKVGKTTVDSGDAAGAVALLNRHEASERMLTLLNPLAEQGLLTLIHDSLRTTAARC